MLSRLAVLTALLLSMPALAEDLPDVSSVDASVGTDGKDTWGHITTCVLGRNSTAVACFGLDKQAKSPARYTYFAIFKHDPKMLRANHGTESEFKVEAEISKMVSTFDLGDLELPVTIDKKLDPKTGKSLEETIKLGDKTVGKDGRVFVIDLSEGKVAIIPLKVELPKSTPDLADQDHQSWGPAIDKAITEVKEKSAEAKKLLQ